MPEGSNWVIVQVHRHKYNPLEGGSWIDLPPEFKNPKYGLVNMKNKDNECFRWCHIRRFNPQEKDPQGIKKEDKLLVDNYDYSGVDFPVKDKHYSRIEAQNNIQSNPAISNSFNSKSPLFRRKIEFPWIYSYVFSHLLSAISNSVISNSNFFPFPRDFEIAGFDCKC